MGSDISRMSHAPTCYFITMTTPPETKATSGESSNYPGVCGWITSFIGINCPRNEGVRQELTMDLAYS